MTDAQAAAVVSIVSVSMESARVSMLDSLIARLLSPIELKWRDARTEAPPEDDRVLAVVWDRIEFATYRGENGQPYRRLPNAECWGHWYREQNHTEGPEQIRWWMPIPLAPVES